MDAERYQTLKALVLTKKNVILQGAPGVGKTFAAKRLAYSIMGEKDASRVQMVQFHQSYSYEDFIMGFRPTETGFAGGGKGRGHFKERETAAQGVVQHSETAVRCVHHADRGFYHGVPAH